MKYIIKKNYSELEKYTATLSVYDDDGKQLDVFKQLQYETKPTDAKILSDFKGLKEDILEEVNFTGEKEISL